MTITSKDIRRDGLTGVARKQREESEKRLNKQLVELLKKKKEPKKKK